MTSRYALVPLPTANTHNHFFHRLTDTSRRNLSPSDPQKPPSSYGAALPLIKVAASEFAVNHSTSPTTPSFRPSESIPFTACDLASYGVGLGVLCGMLLLYAPRKATSSTMIRTWQFLMDLTSAVFGLQRMASGLPICSPFNNICYLSESISPQTCQSLSSLPLSTTPVSSTVISNY